MQIVDIEISKLKDYENNPRKNEKAINAVAESIKQFGFKVPIIIDKDYEVVDVIHDTQELSELVVNTKIDVILMTDISRLTRDRMEYEQIQHMLRGYGVQIELLDKREL